MDEGLLHRLANICKDYYVIRKIDDMFIYSGAKSQWYVEVGSDIHYSQRVRRFLSWCEGVKSHAPAQYDAIIIRVAESISTNLEVPEQERIAVIETLKQRNEDQKEEKGIQLDALLATLVRALAKDGLKQEVAIITSADARLEWMETIGYGDYFVFNLVLSIPYNLYAYVEAGRETYESAILHHVQSLTRAIDNEGVGAVTIVSQFLEDDDWRTKAITWLTGQGVTNQGRVRSDNVAPYEVDGLRFRSQTEINLYKALKPLNVSFAPLPVFVRGGLEYRRIEPDFLLIKDGVIMVVEVDGDTFHRETPAVAHNRSIMLLHEGVHFERIQASEIDTPEKAAHYAGKLLNIIAKVKDARR